MSDLLNSMETDLKNHLEAQIIDKQLPENPNRVKDGQKLKELAVRARFNLGKVISSGMYSDEYVRELREKYRSDIKKMFNAIAERDAAFWSSKMAKYEKEHAPKGEPKGVQEQLLDMRNLEYTLKAADRGELSDMADHIISGELTIKNNNELNIYLAFLNQAELTDQVMLIKNLVKDRHLLEPYKNDNIYKALEKALYETKVYQANKMISLEEDGREEIVFLEDLMP